MRDVSVWSLFTHKERETDPVIFMVIMGCKTSGRDIIRREIYENRLGRMGNRKEIESTAEKIGRKTKDPDLEEMYVVTHTFSC